jgi:hypothetical protein
LWREGLRADFVPTDSSLAEQVEMSLDANAAVLIVHKNGQEKLKVKYLDKRNEHDVARRDIGRFFSPASAKKK